MNAFDYEDDFYDSLKVTDDYPIRGKSDDDDECFIICAIIPLVIIYTCVIYKAFENGFPHHLSTWIFLLVIVIAIFFLYIFTVGIIYYNVGGKMARNIVDSKKLRILY